MYEEFDDKRSSCVTAPWSANMSPNQASADVSILLCEGGSITSTLTKVEQKTAARCAHSGLIAQQTRYVDTKSDNDAWPRIQNGNYT